jgi:outer membrane protein assembly factor BamB
MKKTLISLLVSSVFLTACSSNPELVEPPLKPLMSQVAMKKLWQVKHERFSHNDYKSVLLSEKDQIIYTVSTSGMLSATQSQPKSAWNDQIVWQSKLNEVVTSGPTVLNDRLIIGTAKGRLKAFNKFTGTLEWQVSLATEVVSVPVVANNKIFAQTGDGRLYALNADDGEVVWQVQHALPEISLRGAPAPLVVEGKVFVAWASGKIQALDEKSGVLLWESRVALPQGRTVLERLVDVQSSMVFENGYLYAAAYHGKLVAINPQTGNFAFVKDMSAIRDFVVTESRLFIVSDDDVIHAFDAKSGLPVWQQEALKGRGVGDLYLSGDALITSDRWGYIHWFNTVQGVQTGRVKHASHNQGVSVARLKIKENHLFIYDSEGVLSKYLIETNI